MNRSFVIAFLRRHRTLATAAVHALLAATAYLVAFALRFDLAIPAGYFVTALETLPLLVASKLAAFWACGLLTGWWQHVSVRDVAAIVRGNLLGAGLFLAGMVFGHGLDGFPRAVFPLDLLLCTAAMAGMRVGIRLAREREARPAVRRVERLALIVGAGSAGIRLLDEIESRRHLKLGVAGFVDDDPGKIGLRIAGVPVLGRLDELPALVAAHEIDEVLIAMPSAPGAVLRRAVRLCREADVRHRVLPTLGELVDGRVMYTQMREVKVDDLLVRAPVQLDLPRVRSFVAGTTVLVTGAAGSIGSELCRQLAGYGPARLVLYDRHENGVFVLEMELRQRFPDVTLIPILGDVLLEDQLRSVFEAYRPQTVFHAAAYKHVPLAELNVLEAVRNNVLGTRNVARAAVAHGARELVLVSTDKAVRPTSVMGVTKRIAELVVQSMQDGATRFVAVRFGNVLGSNGSVVPLFRDQIARGGPVTVTHPEVTRYFMTIPEAVQLILQAATIAEGGEILVLDMGEPVRIVDLARHMIELSGLEPDEDVAIAFTGLRPGEKLHEELFTAEEATHRTQLDRINVLRAAGPGASPGVWLARLQASVEAGDLDATLRTIIELVPSYRPSELLRGRVAERPRVPVVFGVPQEPPAPPERPAARAAAP